MIGGTPLAAERARPDWQLWARGGMSNDICFRLSGGRP
jgi:hypothetical protein